VPRTSGAELKDEGNLAITYVGMGRYEEAEQLLTNSLQDIDGIELRARRAYRRHLGEIYREQGKYAAAEDALLETLNSCRQLPGSDLSRHSRVVRCINELARLYVMQGRYEEADSLFSEGIEIGECQLPGKDHPFTLRHVNGLGVLRTQQGQYEEAKTLFSRALEGRKLKLGEDHPHTLESKNDLAVLYKEQGDYAKAEPLLLDALHGRESTLGPNHPHTLDALRQLVALYESWNRPDEAAKWRAQLPAEEE